MPHKKILISFLICYSVCNTIFAQDWCDTLIANIRGKKLLSVTYPEIKQMKQHAYLFKEKETEFGVKELFAVCDNGTASKNNNGLDVYLININSKNDTTFLVDVATFTMTNNAFGSWQKQRFYRAKGYLDSSMANAVLQLHNSKYVSNWKLDDYFKGMDTSEVYQSAIDLAGADTTLEIYLSRLIKAKNHNRLMAMASALKPEIRAYGTIGLYLLKLSSEQLSAYEEQLIALNQSSNIVINKVDFFYRYFPLYDNIVDESAPMTEQLNAKMMKDYYAAFKYNGLL